MTPDRVAEPFPISLPGVLQHLQVMEQSGLIRSEKVGRVRTCSIEPRALRAAEGWLAERRSGWERRLDRLGAFLAQADAERERPGHGHPHFENEDS